MTKTNKRAAFIPATSSGVFCRISITFWYSGFIMGIRELLPLPLKAGTN